MATALANSVRTLGHSRPLDWPLLSAVVAHFLLLAITYWYTPPTPRSRVMYFSVSSLCRFLRVARSDWPRALAIRLMVIGAPFKTRPPSRVSCEISHSNSQIAAPIRRLCSAVSNPVLT